MEQITIVEESGEAEEAYQIVCLTTKHVFTNLFILLSHILPYRWPSRPSPTTSNMDLDLTTSVKVEVGILSLRVFRSNFLRNLISAVFAKLLSRFVSV